MTPLQALIDARALIADPEHWTQGAFARDAAGVKVASLDPGACCWCTVGALAKAGGGFMRDMSRYAIESAIRGDSITQWNDAPERTHAEVLAAFDAAIARLEAQP